MLPRRIKNFIKVDIQMTWHDKDLFNICWLGLAWLLDVSMTCRVAGIGLGQGLFRKLACAGSWASESNQC
jgi:hypothetical protein